MVYYIERMCYQNISIRQNSISTILTEKLFPETTFRLKPIDKIPRSVENLKFHKNINIKIEFKDSV